jgi:hypothetical protein
MRGRKSWGATLDTLFEEKKKTAFCLLLKLNSMHSTDNKKA